MRVTVLGLGGMGRAVAGRLVQGGHQVTVWNRSAGKADQLVGEGAVEIRDPGRAVAGAEVVLTSLRDDEAVLEVLVRGGILPIEDGAIVVDHTTVAPETAAALSDAYPAFVAAPILGAPAAVASGAAVYAVGGRDRDIDRMAPVFDSLGGNVLRVSDRPAIAVGLKLVNNSLLLSGLAVLSEAVAVAQAVGIPDEWLGALLRGSPMVPAGLHNRLDDMISGDHDGWFAMPLGAKDLGLFAALARSWDVEVPVAERVRERYLEAAAAGWDEADVAGVIELLRRR